jgi:hemolysin activation/secretion protein
LVLPQAARDGLVTVTVREGQLDRVDLPDASKSALPRVARDALAQSARLGEPINVTALQESLLLINHLPAAPRASAQMEPSAPDGQNVVRVGYVPAHRVSGALTADNAGHRFTGHGRLRGSLQVHDPLGVADQLTLTALTSGQQLRFGQADYAVPITPRTSVNATLSDVRYNLCCQPLGVSAQGFARTARLDTTYHWTMQAQRQMTLFASVDSTQLQSEYTLPAHRMHRIKASTLGARGAWRDSGVNHWSYAARVGRVNLADNAADLASDQSGAQTHGSFAKALGSFYRLQSIGAQWSVLAQVRVQANLERNLESAERISLGGAHGVRAYAAGEGVGDSGVLANLEVRYAVADAPGLSLFGLFDTGTVRRYSKNQDALTGTIPNSYALTGMGVGLRYELPSVSVSVTVARPWGNNAGADAAGNNNEGQRDGTRGWVTAAWKF